jgi:hypothetical protein
MLLFIDAGRDDDNAFGDNYDNVCRNCGRDYLVADKKEIV